MSLWLYM